MPNIGGFLIYFQHTLEQNYQLVYTLGKDFSSRHVLIKDFESQSLKHLGDIKNSDGSMQIIIEYDKVIKSIHLQKNGLFIIYDLFQGANDAIDVIICDESGRLAVTYWNENTTKMHMCLFKDIRINAEHVILDVNGAKLINISHDTLIAFGPKLIKWNICRMFRELIVELANEMPFT